MYSLGLRELTESSLALAEQARLCFEAFELKETDRSSVEDHVWFTNTALYCAWVDPPVGAAASPFSVVQRKSVHTLGSLFGGKAGGGELEFFTLIAVAIDGSLYL